MTYQLDLNQLAQMLTSVSADCSRDEWVKHLMAIKSEFGEQGQETARAWSAAGSSYKPKDFNTTWKSIKTNGGITIASLIHDAKLNGFQFTPISPKERVRLQQQAQQRKAQKAKEQAISKAQELAQHRAKAKQAQAIIKAAKPAPDGHPYLIRKGINPHGVLFGSFLKYQNALVIPIYGTVGEFEGLAQSVQFIMPDGVKIMLKGAKKAGGYYPIQWVEDAPIVICEGFSTGCTLAEHYAKTDSVIVAFDAGNLTRIAQYFKKHYPTAEIIIAGDNDHEKERETGINTGAIKANEAAAAVHGKVSLPYFEPHQKGSDWNDYYNLHNSKNSTMEGEK